MSKATTPAPVSRDTFTTKAKALQVTIDGVKYEAEPRQFSTGSFGSYLSGKVNVKIDGVSVPCQMGVNLTVIDSKNTK